MRVQLSSTWQRIVSGQALVVVDVVDGPIQYADSEAEPSINTAVQAVTMDPNLEVMFGCWLRCPIPGVTGVVDVEIQSWAGLEVTTPDGSIPYIRAMTRAQYNALPALDPETLYAIIIEAP